MDPGQNEKPTLIGDQMEVLPTDCSRPADKTVTTTNMARRRTVDHTGDRPLMGKDQILEVFSHGLAIAQIVILLDQTVAKLLKRRTPYLTDLQGENRRKRTLDRIRVNGHWSGFFSVDQGIERILLLRWQLNITSPLKRQHQTPADHVTQRPIGLPPVPSLTEFMR